MSKHGDIKIKLRLSIAECIILVDDEVRKVFEKVDRFSNEKSLKYANELRNFYIRSGFSVNGNALINGRDIWVNQ